MFPVTWMEKKNQNSIYHSDHHPMFLPCPTGTPPSWGLLRANHHHDHDHRARRQPSLWTFHYPRSSLTNGSSLKIRPSCPLLREAFSDLPQMDGPAAPSLSHSATGESSSVWCLASRCGLWTNSTATPWVLRRNADSHFTPNLQNRNLHLNKLSR